MTSNQNKLQLEASRYKMPTGVLGLSSKKRWKDFSRGIESKFNRSNYLKNKKAFKYLEQKYIDRLNLLGTQRQMLHKQDMLLNSKKKKIINNRKNIIDYRSKIQTNKRLNYHDLEYSKIRSNYNFYLKIVLVGLLIVMVTLIAIKYKK